MSKEDKALVKDLIGLQSKKNNTDELESGLINDELKERKYGNIFVKGHIYSDMICI